MPARHLLLIAPLLLVVASCGDDAGGPDEPAAEGSCGVGPAIGDRALRVATTVAPITNLVGILAGGTDTEITGVVPEGTNSHTYEPTPGVAAVLEDADVVFLNGLTLEEPTKELALANLRATSELCELGTTILPDDEYLYDFSFPEEGGKPNPHLWTNPPMALAYAELIRDVLVARSPRHADVYDANLEAFADQVGLLDAAIRTATATVPEDERLLLTYHDAYAYFAQEYGWTVVGAVQPSSFTEPTPQEVADLIGQIEERGVTAVFGSEVFPSPVLEQIAAESGATYVDDLRDDDLPGAPGDPDHSWLELMRFNYTTIVEALGGDATALRSLDLAPFATDAATYPQ